MRGMFYFMFFALYVLFYFICFIFICFVFVLYVLFLSSVLRCKRISKQRDAGSESTHVVMLSQMYIKCILNLLLDFKELVCIKYIYIQYNIYNV